MNDVDKTIWDNENVCGEFTSYNSLWHSPIMLQIMFFLYYHLITHPSSIQSPRPPYRPPEYALGNSVGWVPLFIINIQYIYGRIMLCYNWTFSFIPGSSCLDNFRLSPFSARGNCTCTKGPLQCDCHEGFTGFMCSSIGSRYCTLTDIKLPIPHCKGSNEESCYLNQDGKYYLCKAFDGKF